MTKIIRKHPVELIDNSNEENIVKVSVVVESNHINNNLDAYLMSLNSSIKNLFNYTLKIKEIKEVKKDKRKKKKFSDGGYV